MYASVEDIDLYMGGISETPLPGASVGPTFASIVAKQFRMLRVADRFFYDDLSQGVSPTPSLLIHFLSELLMIKISRINHSLFINADLFVSQRNWPRSRKSV